MTKSNNAIAPSTKDIIFKELDKHHGKLYTLEELTEIAGKSTSTTADVLTKLCNDKNTRVQRATKGLYFIPIINFEKKKLRYPSIDYVVRKLAQVHEFNIARTVNKTDTIIFIITDTFNHTYNYEHFKLIFTTPQFFDKKFKTEKVD